MAFPFLVIDEEGVTSNKQYFLLSFPVAEKISFPSTHDKNCLELLQKQPSRDVPRRCCRDDHSCFATLLKSHVGMGVLL